MQVNKSTIHAARIYVMLNVIDSNVFYFMNNTSNNNANQIYNISLVTL
jgi:hypothetical protein